MSLNEAKRSVWYIVIVIMYRGFEPTPVYMRYRLRSPSHYLALTKIKFLNYKNQSKNANI